MSLPTKEAIEQVKNVTSPLKFFIYMCGVVAVLTIGIAGWSKMDAQTTKWIVLILFTYFMIVSLVSFCLVVYDPKRYLYTREEWAKKDNLTDSKAVAENKQISNINVTAYKDELSNGSNLENQ